jgi:hypothetical protein
VQEKKRPRNRRSYAQLFVDKLVELAGKEQKLIGNKTLRDELGWDEARYKRVREDLIAQKQIIAGRGYGGSVGLATLPGSKGLNLFVSYCHADEGLKSDLLKHLEPIRRLNLIETWHDRKIKAGEDWDKIISSNLEKADIVLLLVSIDFINSAYCYDVELERALEKHAEGRTRVIPVILRACMWSQTPFAKLQALPKDARAVSLWTDRDEALLNIAEGVRQVAEELLSST